MKKTTKIEFTFEDGSSKFLEGDEAEKWSRWNGNICQIAHFHGSNPDWTSLNWKFVINDLDKYDFNNTQEEVINE